MKEAERLSSTWGFEDAPPVFYQASQEDSDALPDLTVEPLRQAIAALPKKAASTRDGLHPRHSALLEVVIGRLYFV